MAAVKISYLAVACSRAKLPSDSAGAMMPGIIDHMGQQCGLRPAAEGTARDEKSINKRPVVCQAKDCNPNQTEIIDSIP
jgi:hypothetical protein